MTKAYSYYRILLSALILLIGGCEIIGPDRSENDDLADARVEWANYQDGTYSYLLNRGCFCIVAGPHFVQVVDSQVVSAISTHSNEVVRHEDLQYIETVEDVFDMIEDALETADKIDVEYSEFGYPTSVDIDWIKQAVDDEMFITISEVQLGITPID